MGVKRISRGKLFDTEKLGINKLSEINAGPGMEKAIVSATQHREGFKLITEIVVDLGTTKDTIKTGGTTAGMPVGAEDASGVAQLSYICQLTPAVFGVVSQIDTVCLEAPTDGTLAGANAYQLEIGDANGKIGVAVTNPVTIHSDMNSIGDARAKHNTTRAGDSAFVANSVANKYLYIAGGSAVNTAAGAATASITVGDNFATSQLEDDKTRIVVIATDGTVVTHVFDADTAKGGSSSGTIGYDGTPSLAEMATSIAAAIHNHAKFTASATDKVVNITQGTAGVGGNTTIALINGVSAAGAALSADLTIESFTGGTTAGTSTAMTAGKFLIRVEGFLTPDDV